MDNNYNIGRTIGMSKTDQALRNEGIKFNNETTKKSHVEKVISHLRENLIIPKGTKIDIKHLWGNNYRVNFWAKKKTEIERFIDEKEIVDSKFIVVRNTMNGLEHKVIE